MRKVSRLNTIEYKKPKRRVIKLEIIWENAPAAYMGQKSHNGCDNACGKSFERCAASGEFRFRQGIFSFHNST